MDTRLILQIVLGVIISLVVVLGVLMIITLTGDADTVVVEKIDESVEEQEDENPWAEMGEAAVSLVENRSLDSAPPVDGSAGDWTVGELMEHDEFVDEYLRMGAGEPNGWKAQWWGETRFGPSFYLVRYTFEDANVTVGPAWLVDLRPDSQQVVPKNVSAQVVTDPEEGLDSDYYDQSEQVVAAIVNHRFPADINLGGALLLYFGGLEEASDANRVLGWTVEHSRDELFDAYFQWVHDDEFIYARFEFDFDDHALRPANLQANEIMRIGEDFSPQDRVDIMPTMYDPTSERWQGAARQRCRQRAHRDGCNSLAMILDNDELIETLEWTLTEHIDSVADFEECREVSEGQDRPDCRWEPSEHEDGVYRVQYIYDLGDGAQEVVWDVHLDDERVEPVGSTGELAFRAVHPRGL